MAELSESPEPSEPSESTDRPEPSERSEPSEHRPPDPAEAGRPFPIVAVVTGCALGCVAIIAVVMAVGLRGGTARENPSGLADDVEAFTTVVLSSRPPERAYDHLAAACRDQFSFAQFEAAVDEARVDIADRFGIDLGLLAVAEIDTRSVESGAGEASVSLEEIGFDEIPVGDVFVATGWSDWTYEAGLWRATDCDRPGDLVDLTTDGP